MISRTGGLRSVVVGNHEMKIVAAQKSISQGTGRKIICALPVGPYLQCPAGCIPKSWMGAIAFCSGLSARGAPPVRSVT